jgi:hypothetical protein
VRKIPNPRSPLRSSRRAQSNGIIAATPSSVLRLLGRTTSGLRAQDETNLLAAS